MAGDIVISVITVVRNRRTGFLRTAESVCCQDSHQFEWIVVDGASSDGTLDAITAFSPKIAWWVSEPDGGVYDAMNKGIYAARGEYLVFMNAGDVFYACDTLSSVTDIMVKYRESTGGTGPDLLFGAAAIRFPSGRSRLHLPRPTSYLRHSLNANHQATYIRTALHRTAPHDTAHYRISSDYYTIAKMVTNGATSLNVDQVLAIRDSSPSSHALSSGWEHYRECARVQRDVFKAGALWILWSGLRRFAAKSVARMRSARPSPAAMGHDD